MQVSYTFPRNYSNVRNDLKRFKILMKIAKKLDKTPGQNSKEELQNSKENKDRI